MALTLGTQGAQSLVAIEPGASTHTFDVSSECYEYLSESIILQGSILDTNAMRGTRSHSKEVTRQGPDTVGGSIVFNPAPNMLDLWLPRILGAAESTDTFALDETLPAFGVLIDRVGEEHQYNDCYVNRAVFRGRQGQLVELELDIWGASETFPGTAFPAITPGVASNDAPYIFSDATTSLWSSSRTILDFEVVIDNMLERRWANSITATAIMPRDRVVTFRCTVPYTSTEAGSLYDVAVAGTSGTLTLTNGGMSTLFTFANLQAPPRSPAVRGKTENLLQLEMVARKSSTTDEVVVTHDSVA